MNVAAVDIGTNSVRLLIADGQGRQLVRHMRITRLGQDVEATGVLHPEAVARTTAVLSEYGQVLAAHGVGRVRAVATSAARDAGNSDGFFRAAEAALGHRPTLISGDEEARLSFAGATAGLSIHENPPPFLVVDIGGGSTELVLGQSQPEQLVSVALGCVRMTDRYLRSDPPTRDELAACRAHINEVVSSEVRSAVDVARAQTVVGLAGTVTTLCHLALGLHAYDPARTHHSVLSLSRVRALTAQLSSADLEARRRLLAEPGRADVIVGGALVLQTLMEALALPSLVVSEADILDGLVASLL